MVATTTRQNNEQQQLLVVAWLPGSKIAHERNMQHEKERTVKLLPLPQPPVRARTDARTNPSSQRATQLMTVLTLVYDVSRHNQTTTNVP
jgi:hypothetical protein